MGAGLELECLLKLYPLTAELEGEDAVQTGVDYTEKTSLPSAPAFIAMGINLTEEQ